MGAARVLSSDGVAPDDAARLNELKKLHPKESNLITDLSKMLTRTPINLTRQQYSSKSSRSPNLLQLKYVSRASAACRKLRCS